MSNAVSNLPNWALLASWVAVVEAGSISEAARRVELSQAGVSQHIKQLETMLGATLLDRSTRPALPTVAGQRLFDHASELLARAGQMTDGVRSLSRAKRTVVKFGCVDSFGATVGPALIRALAGNAHLIRLWSGLSPGLNDSFGNRQLDLLVTTSELRDGALVRRYPLFSESCYVVIPKDHEVNGALTLNQLAKRLPFMRYTARSVLGSSIDHYLESFGNITDRTYEFDATDPLLALVAAGLGFTITTPLCIWQSRHVLPQIRLLPLSAFTSNGQPCPPLWRTFYLAFRDGELGDLPIQVRDVIDIAVQRQVAPEIAHALGLAQEQLLKMEGGAP